MHPGLRIVVVEDSPADAELLLRRLKQDFSPVEFRRVDSVQALCAALDEAAWDMVVSDYEVPSYDVLSALQQVRARPDYLPFIIVSGVIGEDTAVEAMRLGADDYVMKRNLARLVPAIKRELEANRARRELQDRERRLQALTTRVTRLQEDERRKLAAELHDEVGQILTALSINLSLVESRLNAPDGDALPLVTDSRSLLERMGEYIRQVVAELRPAAPDRRGLPDALRNLAGAFEKRAGVPCSVDAGAQRLPTALELVLQRIAREALVNAAKHAGAAQAGIVLRIRPGGAVLQIADNGCGFDAGAGGPGDTRTHWGLMLMRERIESVGGRLRIISAPGRGTRVIAAWRGTA